MLPRSGADLPPWRRHVTPVLMALFRAAAGAFVVRGPVETLLAEPSFVRDAVGAPAGWAIVALLAAGAVLFTVPRTVFAGVAVLFAGLGAFEWAWYRAGMYSGPAIGFAMAIVAVLAAGEWLSRRVRRRVYAPPREP